MADVTKKSFSDSALNNAVTITQPADFVSSLKGLLQKKWILEGNTLKVMREVQLIPNQKPTPIEVTVTDASSLIPAELGILVGDTEGKIYTGPFITNFDGQIYTFATTRDNRFGDNVQHCFILYSALNSTVHTPTTVANIDCNNAVLPRQNLSFLPPVGFSELSSADIALLNSLSYTDWKMNRKIPASSATSFDLEISESIRFFLDSKYNNIMYSSNIQIDRANYAENLTAPIKIYSAQTAPHTTEFIIWNTNELLFPESQNRFGFMHMYSGMWSIADTSQAFLLRDQSVGYYCYAGHDCGVDIALASLHPIFYQQISPKRIRFIYDSTHADQLTVIYEFLDPRFASGQIEIVYSK